MKLKETTRRCHFSLALYIPLKVFWVFFFFFQLLMPHLEMTIIIKMTEVSFGEKTWDLITTVTLIDTFFLREHNILNSLKK